MGKNKIQQTQLFREGMNLLSVRQRQDVFMALEMYEIFPYHPSLRNHSLHERESRIRSIFVEDDLRIILRDRGDGMILLLDVGDHERVYGR